MNLKTAYRFNQSTKLYQGTTKCQESPLEPGVWLLAANSTFTQPLESKQGFQIKWNGSSWEYIENHIGTILWKDYNTSVQIKELGPIPDEYKDYTTERPEKLITYEDYDQAMQAHLTAERTARGYTLREPSDYKDDPYQRFNQDALDWIAHRSEVMVYRIGNSK